MKLVSYSANLLSLTSAIRREVDEKCALMHYYAASCKFPHFILNTLHSENRAVHEIIRQDPEKPQMTK